MTDEHADQEQTPLRYEGGVPVLPTPADRENAARSAEKKEQQEYNREQVAIQRGIFKTQVALVIFGILGSIISAYQAHTARQSAGAAQFAAQTAANTLAETSANDARQAVSSTDALQITINQFHLDQRAWIGIGDINGTPTVNEVWEIVVVFHNSGKTFARDFSGYAVVEPEKRGQVPAFDYGKDRKISGALIIPNGDYNVRFDVTKSSKGEPSKVIQPMLDSINDGAVRVYEHGLISYFDVFGKRHWFAYCFFWDPGTRGFAACKEHNDTGDGYPAHVR